MTDTAKRTILLSDEEEAYVASKVDSGDFASPHEVISEGLRQLKDHDEAIEKWLRDEVVPTYDALKKDPSLAVPLEVAFEQIRAKHKFK